MFEPSEEDLKELREAQKRIEKEEIDQHSKDQEVLEAVKKQVSIEFFGFIEDEITESEHTTNYRILDEPIGDLERAEDIKVWVDQHSVGISGDSWAGAVCVELPDGKYLAWDYWM
jgi:hypothetical protein